MLPAPLHVGVAKLCIKNGTSLVTASYVSPEMSKLHERCVHWFGSCFDHRR